MPMHLCFDPVPDWSVKAVPIQVNVIQHPLPTALRCYKFGQQIKNAISSWEEDLNVVILGTGGMSHQLSGERFGYINSDFDFWWLDKIEKEIVSFVTLNSHFSNFESILLKNCKAKLPDYMIPSKIIKLEKFPYGKTGKHDLATLKDFALKLSVKH